MLTCCAAPQSDVVIEARTVPGAGEFPVRKMPARVMAIARPAPDVAVLTLQLPANEGLRQYHAGQYVEFILRDGAAQLPDGQRAAHAVRQAVRRSSCTSATCRAASSPTMSSAQ